MKKNVSLLILGVILGACLVTTGTMDYNDAQAEHAQYCKMVRLGAWAPYKGMKGCPVIPHNTKTYNF